ncbi:kinesin-associated protein 3 isoform X1 [Schistocerca nitens]|uniref:kinesin-associated protein 3 isoform X1 n=2 Tax=Schistocerca nitens TaxID=7011 RepID=UPI00211909EB|nr:kinesin-associated protein 3 isoform X1 [Schistocerca nitens]
MQSEDARYLKKKIRSRSIDVHPTEKALVVTYELEAFILGDLGDPLLGDRKECQKIIRLKSLNEDTNCAVLAEEVIAKCSLIHPSKLQEVTQLIYYLQNRKDVGNASEKVENMRPGSSCSSSDAPSSNDANAEKANINNIEQYVELLYEDIPEKVNGSALILQLARNPDNLEELATNESVLSALSRVLREDWKKSIELSTNIVYIFFCFSTYSQFHRVILQYKIGSLCMEIIDYELRRYDQWKEDKESKRRKCEGNQNRCSMSAIESHRYQSESIDVPSEPRRRLADGISHIPIAAGENRRRPIEGIHSANDGWKKQLNYQSSQAAESPSDIKKLTEDYEKMKLKFQNLVKKQDQLLRVSFYLLLNIAEDTKVEDKMRKKNICGMLTKSLDRDNCDLLILVVTFLKKLSIFRENIIDMADIGVIEKLPRVLMMNNSDLIHITLKLLMNLSFDTHLRERMVRVGLIPKIVTLLGEQRHEVIVLRILYHLSMDDKCKSMFTYTDCIPMVMTMLLESPEDELHLELIALCINLAINKRNAQMMIENNRLQALMSRAFRNQDSLLMKMIRNIAQHEETKQNFVEFVGDIAQAVIQCTNEDFVVECVGVLGNMTIPDLDFSQLMQRFNLIPWVSNIMVPGKYEDDLVLEVVVLLGTAAADEGCAQILCKADILLSLIEMLKAKQEDDEMVLQIIYVFYQILRHIATRDYLIKETEAPAYLIDLMHDKNTQIRKVCGVCLDIIAECNVDWAERIKLEKFRWHNSQWLEMVESTVMDNTTCSLEPDMNDMPPYYTDDILQRTLLYPSASDLDLDRTDDLAAVGDGQSNIGNRPRSRYAHDIEPDLGEPTSFKNATQPSEKSSDEVIRNKLNNLFLTSEQDRLDDEESKHVMI